MNPSKLSRVVTQKLENYNWVIKKNWQLLRWGEDLNLKENKLRQTIERNAAKWFEARLSRDLLLQGQALIEAEQLYARSGDLFSFKAAKYIISSIEFREEVSKSAKIKNYRQLIAGATATVAVISVFTLSTTSLNSITEAEVSSTLENPEIVS